VLPQHSSELIDGEKEFFASLLLLVHTLDETYLLLFLVHFVIFGPAS